MSYDVSIRCEHCNASLSGYEDNYTYNLAPMFYWAIKGGLNALDGKRGSEAAVLLNAALAGLEAHPDISRFDASNGWGTAAGGMELLHKLRDAARENPRGIVCIS